MKIKTLVRPCKKILKRFEKYFEKGKKNECWLWKGGVMRHEEGRDYGAFAWPLEEGRYRAISASRASYFLTHNKLLPSDIEVCHSCDTPRCVNPNHLFEGTHKDNMNDRDSKGRVAYLRGSDRPNSKLTEEKVKAIKASYDPPRVLAKRYNVSLALIQKIKAGEAWAHVKGPRRRHDSGQGHYRAKLTDSQVKAIRKDARVQWKIAQDYGISRAYVSELKSGSKRKAA